MFIWNEKRKNSVEVGMTIIVETSPVYDNGRYEITGKLDNFIIIKYKGINASVPYHRCDFVSLER